MMLEKLGDDIKGQWNLSCGCRPNPVACVWKIMKIARLQVFIFFPHIVWKCENPLFSYFDIRCPPSCRSCGRPMIFESVHNPNTCILVIIVSFDSWWPLGEVLASLVFFFCKGFSIWDVIFYLFILFFSIIWEAVYHSKKITFTGDSCTQMLVLFLVCGRGDLFAKRRRKKEKQSPPCHPGLLWLIIKQSKPVWFACLHV